MGLLRRAPALLFPAGADAYRTAQGVQIAGVAALEVERHYVTQKPMRGPWWGCEQAVFQGGDFYLCEERFVASRRIEATIVGFCGGAHTPRGFNTITAAGTHDDCGHAEAVKVVYPRDVGYALMLYLFWTSHNPVRPPPPRAAGKRKQGSAIYTFSERQHALALASKAFVEDRIGRVVTDVRHADALDTPFTPVEAFHQQAVARGHVGHRAVCGLRGLRRELPQGEFLAAMAGAAADLGGGIDEDAQAVG